MSCSDITAQLLRPDAAGEEIVRLRNTVGHCWYFPARGLGRFMSLFQPSSLKGTVAALALPYIIWCRLLLRVVHAERVRVRWSAAFRAQVARAFGVEAVELAMFCGSPGRHRKPTLLVWGAGRVLGYCKVSDSAEVVELFRREARTLRWLRGCGVRHVPEAVCCEELAADGADEHIAADVSRGGAAACTNTAPAVANSAARTNVAPAADNSAACANAAPCAGSAMARPNAADNSAARLPRPWLFCQTTERAGRVRVAQLDDGAVVRFVRQMNDCTRVRARLADTDFGADLDRLERELLPLLGDAAGERTVREAIATVRRELGTGAHDFAAAHGDLTPWNSFLPADGDGGSLYVFDFEYARRTMPPYMDLFHFFTQQLTYDFSATAAQIGAEYVRRRATTFAAVPRADLAYTCYLLAIIAFYLGRDHGVLNARLRQQFGIWTELLKMLHETERAPLQSNGGGGQSAPLFHGLKGSVLYLMRRFR